jgi:hypothetical protein
VPTAEADGFTAKEASDSSDAEQGSPAAEADGFTWKTRSVGYGK